MSWAHGRSPQLLLNGFRKSSPGERDPEVWIHLSSSCRRGQRSQAQGLGLCGRPPSGCCRLPASPQRAVRAAYSPSCPPTSVCDLARECDSKQDLSVGRDPTGKQTLGFFIHNYFLYGSLGFIIQEAKRPMVGAGWQMWQPRGVTPCPYTLEVAMRLGCVCFRRKRT